MTPKVKRIYRNSIIDQRFLDEIYLDDGDKKPSFFASDNEKILFATLYYGWLVANYGKDFENYLIK